MSTRTNRISEDIKRELSVIFRSLKDPRISEFLTVMRVDVSGDLSYADVYVSALDGFDTAKKSVEGLKSAKGHIKRELSAHIESRKMPELRFIADSGAEHSAKISKMLEELK